MTVCPGCSAANAAGIRFCENCGTPLFASCERCGHKSTLEASYCGFCGAPLQSAQRIEHRFRNESASSWGELKQATVLFADIVRSTEVVAALDAELAMERLQPAVTAMCDAVERFEGTVVRTLGDGILALFGAPRAQEGHALLACQAAMAMQDSFARSGDRLAIRIGLHSGEIVSPLDPEANRERSIHGLAIHVANRVLEMSEPGTTAITEDCYRLVQSHCDVAPLGVRQLRGVAKPVEIFRLLQLKPAVASQQFRGTALTSFRGREHELGLLQHALRATEDGETSVIGIAGAAGMGKSRLCFEFAEWCRRRQIPIFEARAQLYGHATPLQPVLEFLRSLFFHIAPDDDAAKASARIAERLAKMGPTFNADLPLLCDFLGVASEEHAPSKLNPRARHARLLDIVRHMIRRGGATTSVIIVEDLHWLDEASEDFVATLVDAVAGTRTLLVLNYRPSHVASWMETTYYKEITLGELRPAETDALVEDLIGDNADLRDIRAQVAKRSGGNPFFAEELVRSLAENGVLAGDAGAYLPGRMANESALPATAQAVIGARIDRLGELEKNILQTCAIIGKEIPLAVLERVVDAPPAQVESALRHLGEGGLVQMQSGTADRQYAFRHPLIQEVAYSTQLKARRTSLHASVAEAMEDYYKDRLSEFAGLLAYHYESAGHSLSAAKHTARAALWVGSTDTAQAIKHWRKVRQLLQQQPRSAPNDQLRIMASGQISWLGWREGLTAEEAKPFIEEALEWARETDDTMIPLLLFVEGRIIGASGGPADTYVEGVKRAVALLGPHADAGRAATLNASLSQAYGWAGLLKQALAANDAALAGVAKIDRFDHQFLGYSVEHWTISLRGRILARLGRFDEAERCFAAMLGLEQALTDPTVQFISHLGYVDIAWCRNDPALGHEHAMRVREIADKHGSPYLRVYAFACAGISRSIAHDFAGARSELEEGLKFLRKTRAAMENEAEMLANLAESLRQAGYYELAITTAREAIEVARQRSSRLPECRASATLAGSLLAQYGATERPTATALIARATELMNVSGAMIYADMLERERARLI